MSLQWFGDILFQTSNMGFKYSKLTYIRGDLIKFVLLFIYKVSSENQGCVANDNKLGVSDKRNK